jgi:hypothetical protein
VICVTAEISVMNKEAVAIAADSAITRTEEEGQKIFTSANKIFALSRHHTIGIMIYQNSSFMEVPWETLVKIYRDRLGKKKFDTLKEYAKDFLHFLEKENQMFPEFIQEKYFLSHVYYYFSTIREEIDQRVNVNRGEKEIIVKKRIEEIISEIIENHYFLWKNAELHSSVPEHYVENLMKKYQTELDEVKKKVFEGLSIDRISSEYLLEIGAWLFAKSPEGFLFPDYSGVVFVGFGSKEIFPVLQSFMIEGKVDNHLKYFEDDYTEITFGYEAAVIAFAQKEMVQAFMEGTQESYQEEIERYLSEIFNLFPDVILDSLENLDDNEKVELKRKLKELSNNKKREYLENLIDYRRKNYTDPIIKVVKMLPKVELAAMAESLVNLTSFKRRVSMEEETVGGPIDVAVISKGDGFVWIKRKSYFKPELNP